MSKRGRGRPPKTERDFWGQVLWIEALMEEETAAMRRRGLVKPVNTLQRAALRLDISERSAWRRMAEARAQLSIDWSQQPLGDLLLQLQRDLAQKNARSDLLAVDTCSAE